MKLLILLIWIICLISVTAFPSEAQELQNLLLQWLNSLKIEPGVTAELKAFRYRDTPLSPEYLEALPLQLRRRVISRAEEQIGRFLDDRCKPSVKVSFMKSGFAVQNLNIPQGRTEEEFEKGFLRVEVVACFPEARLSVDEVLQMYTSPEFRMDVSSTIKGIEDVQGRSCVETKGVTAILRPTLYCNHIEEFHQSGIASQHSQVVANPEPKAYQNVYFKESLKTFVELSEGLAFYYINYSRSNKLGTLKRGFGQNAIIRSQKSAIEELRKRIREEE